MLRRSPPLPAVYAVSIGGAAPSAPLAARLHRHSRTGTSRPQPAAHKENAVGHPGHGPGHGRGPGQDQLLEIGGDEGEGVLEVHGPAHPRPHVERLLRQGRLRRRLDGSGALLNRRNRCNGRVPRRRGGPGWPEGDVSWSWGARRHASAAGFAGDGDVRAGEGRNWRTPAAASSGSIPETAGSPAGRALRRQV